MRFLYVVFIGFLLTGCKASVSMGLDGELEHGMRFFVQEKQSSSVFKVESGEFSGKFATASAINSDRTFDADYYGTLHIVVTENGKIACDWIVDGRMRDVAVGGLLHASSAVCVGRLQQDGTFGFQGAFITEQRRENDEGKNAAPNPSFTIEGSIKAGVIEGNLLLGEAFAAQKGERDPGVAFLLIPIIP